MEDNSICSHAKSIFLSALTNRSADAFSALIRKRSFTSWEISLSQKKIWGKLWQLTCHQLWVWLPAPSPAEPKPFSKSSMKSAPLALQRGVNEANGRISDAWSCKIRLNYITFTPSYSHPFNILVPCRYWLSSPLSTCHWQSQTSSAISRLLILIPPLLSTSFSFHPWTLRH